VSDSNRDVTPLASQSRDGKVNDRCVHTCRDHQLYYSEHALKVNVVLYAGYPASASAESG
jgi:hypothetical protein